MQKRFCAAAIITVFVLFSSCAHANPVLGVVEALMVKISSDLFVERSSSQTVRDAQRVAVIRLLGDGGRRPRTMYLDTSNLDLDVGDVVRVALSGQETADRKSPLRLLERVVWIEAKASSDQARILVRDSVP